MHLLVLFALAILNAGPPKPSIAQLQPQADAVLKSDTVHAQQKIYLVFELADRLVEAGRLDEADRYYKSGFKIQPYDYNHHLHYAELLKQLDRPDDAAAQAKIVLTECEDPAIILKTQDFLGTPRLQITPLDQLPTAKPILVLIPLGNVDLSLLADEQTKLHDELHIDVLIRFVPFKMPAPDRIPRQQTPENYQWDADKMLDLFTEAIRPFYSQNVRFLGITHNDIYADDSNFYFGWSNNWCGIVSYRRFMAGFNHEIPDRARLLRRFHFQCLASAGNVFGLDRCLDSSCPRGYPQSLEEQDAKSDKLCDTCRKEFDDTFAAYQTAAQNTSLIILIGLIVGTALSLMVVSIISRHPLGLTALVIGLAMLIYTMIGIAVFTAPATPTCTPHLAAPIGTPLHRQA